MEPFLATPPSVPVTGGPGSGAGLSTQGEAQGCASCKALRGMVDDLQRQLDQFSELLLDCERHVQARSGVSLCASLSAEGNPRSSPLFASAKQRLSQ